MSDELKMVVAYLRDRARKLDEIAGQRDNRRVPTDDDWYRISSMSAELELAAQAIEAGYHRQG